MRYRLRRRLVTFLSIVAAVMYGWSVVRAEGWIHPAGLVDLATLQDMRRKCRTYEWARRVVEDLDKSVQPWLKQPLERLDELMPKKKTQVYWLMTCPECRERLEFDPFDNSEATCLGCGRNFPLDQQSTAAPPTSAYAGTLRDGWGCYYLLAISGAAQDLALSHALGSDRQYAQRSADILRMFARYVKPLLVLGGGTQRVIWTYNVEGDCSVLLSLVGAYELIRGTDGLFAPQEHFDIQQDLLKYWVDSVLRVEEDSSPRHNNMYRYLSTVALVGCALEDVDYVDWAFGRRKYSPADRPNHHSLAWLSDNNYLEDGAFWGLCTAYHLYALGPHCRAVVLGRRLAQQMPDLFPPEIYDDLDPQNPRSRVLRRAVKWFTAQTFPDLTMAAFGDMGGRVSLVTYPLTAEIGYRSLGVEEVGSYRSLREGNRGMTGLVYGADAIEEKPWPYQSVFLSSGFVALKREANGNRLYAGLNALQPGSGHAHADRLNLITYSRDRMLTGEKRTRYNDPEQRTYSGASYGHNTVTVDETSQPHGNYLEGDRIPHIDTFLDLPAVQVAEAHGDRVYSQTQTYRRLLCQFDQYLLDVFLVEGGKVHDWFYHGVGEAAVLSLPLASKTGFQPELYVVRGERQYKTAVTDGSFSATWRLPGEPESDFPGRRRDVLCRVTLGAAPGQQVFLLSTFPDPGAHSLMVRHEGAKPPFVAVHEAYTEAPIATAVRVLPGSSAAAVEIEHADGGRRLVIYGSGSSPEETRLEGRLAAVQFNAAGRVVSLALVRGAELRCRGLCLQTDRDASVSITFDAARLQVVSSPPVAYHTVEGEPVYEVGSGVALELKVPATLSLSGEAVDVKVKAPGQKREGPAPVEIGL